MDILKNTVFINLDERVDRREHFLQEFAKLGVQHDGKRVEPHRIAATKMAKGAIGCSMSHIKAIEYAKEKGFHHVFVCEDDITFTQPKELLMSLAKTLNDPSVRNAWDVLIIGGNNWPPFTKRSEHCIQVHNCCSTTGYIVHRRYYDTLLQNYKEGVRFFLQNPEKPSLYAIDVWWKRLQVRDKWLMIVPATVDQWTNNYSNVEGCVTSYSHLMLDYTKGQSWLPPTKSWKMLQIHEKAAVVTKADKPWLTIIPVYKQMAHKKAPMPMQIQMQVR